MQVVDLAFSERIMRCQAARERLEALGVTIAEWAESRGYSRELAYAVLSGRITGKRGIAHRVAIDLGIKPAPDLGDVRNRMILAGLHRKKTNPSGQTEAQPM